MSLKVLIADDDESYVAVVEEALHTCGFKTVSVYEGVRVVETARKEKPDIILLDWKMPAGTGSTVLKNLRQSDDVRDIPVVVITAYANPETEDEARTLGAVDFMAKPVEIDELLEIINEHTA
jgi:two-component system cell cycle response regulator DivK